MSIPAPAASDTRTLIDTRASRLRFDRAGPLFLFESGADNAPLLPHRATLAAFVIVRAAARKHRGDRRAERAVIKRRRASYRSGFSRPRSGRASRAELRSAPRGAEVGAARPVRARLLATRGRAGRGPTRACTAPAAAARHAATRPVTGGDPGRPDLTRRRRPVRAAFPRRGPVMRVRRAAGLGGESQTRMTPRQQMRRHETEMRYDMI